MPWSERKASQAGPSGGWRTVVYDSPQAIWSDWLRLWDETGRVPWTHPGWVERWWHAFGRGRLHLLAVHGDGRLEALFAYQQRADEVRAATNGESPGVPVMVTHDSAAEILWKAILDGRHRLNVFPLHTHTLASKGLHRAAQALGYSRLVKAVGGSPYLPLLSWPHYEAQLPSKLKRELRRRWRLLAGEHALGIELHDGAYPMDPVFERCLELERAGWKGKAGTAILLRPDAAKFYRSLLQWASEEGWLRLALLAVDGRPIAFDLSLEIDGVHYLLKTSFDPEFSRFAPGALLRQSMLHRAFSIGLRRYEFLGSDDPWKLQWTSESRDRVQVRAFPPTVTGRAQHAAFALVRRARELRTPRSGRASATELSESNA